MSRAATTGGATGSAGSSPFDSAAATYDQSFTQTNVGRWQRDIVWQVLGPLIEPGMRVLDLGCGTGQDAVFAAQRGAHVVGVDGSNRMLEVARDKAAPLGLSQRLSFEFARLPELPGEVANSRFDLLFSNFGALNCLADQQLTDLLHDARSLLTPRGRALIVVMPTACWWEQVFFLASGRWRQLGRRRHQGAAAQVGDAEQRTWYYAPADLERLAAPNFELGRVTPVGLLIPPTLLARRLEQGPARWVGSFLTSLERRLASRIGQGAPNRRRWARWLAARADHCLIELLPAIEETPNSEK